MESIKDIIGDMNFSGERKNETPQLSISKSEILDLNNYGIQKNENFSNLVRVFQKGGIDIDDKLKEDILSEIGNLGIKFADFSFKEYYFKTGHYDYFEIKFKFDIGDSVNTKDFFQNGDENLKEIYLRKKIILKVIEEYIMKKYDFKKDSMQMFR